MGPPPARPPGLPVAMGGGSNNCKQEPSKLQFEFLTLGRSIDTMTSDKENKVVANPYVPETKRKIPKELIKLIPTDIVGGSYRRVKRRFVKTQPKMSKPVWTLPAKPIDLDLSIPRPPKLERDSDEERRWLKSTNGELYPPKGYVPVKIDRRRKYPKDPLWKPY